MDATHPVRNYFNKKDFHDYENQKQGPRYKEVRDAAILTLDEYFDTNVSLYRPKTKKGDPRLWIYSLARYVNPNDILAMIIVDGNLLAIDVSQVSIRKAYEEANSTMYDVLWGIEEQSTSVAKELLSKIKLLAQSPIPTEVEADTGIGRTLETHLGIPINSSQEPDFKGIELKSFRAYRSTNRNTLFGKVPNWELSKIKSSEEILQEFGYWDEKGVFALRCTVSATKPNSQGLFFRIDSTKDWLIEAQENLGDFAIWEFNTLKRKLLHKHSETFWIETNNVNIDGKEHFIYSRVFHTKNPQVENFPLLIGSGDIDMDHLISKVDPSRAATEKGPLFKIKGDAKSLLFLDETIYNLSP